MNFFGFVEQRGAVGKRMISAFGNDALRLLRASPVFGGFVIGTGVALGLVPVMLWQYFGNFIDACFGARGTGAMTTDLSHNAFAVGFTGTIVIVAFAYFLQTKALSRTIASTIAVGIFFVTHSFALLPIEKSFIIFLGILGLGFHVAHHRAVRVMMTLALGLLAIASISDILLMMTRRSMTVGSAVEYCAVILSLSALSVYLAHRNASIT